MPGPHDRSKLLRAAPLLLALAACGPSPIPVAAADIDDPAGTLARLASEPEGPGRKPLVQALRKAPAARVLPILETGLASGDPALRSAAALAVSRRSDTAGLAPTLIALATTDPDTGVRIAATRGLANLRHLAAFPALTQNLAHTAPAIRLSALRALARLDPDRAAALPDLARLQLDPDPRVADTATKVARGLALRP